MKNDEDYKELINLNNSINKFLLKMQFLNIESLLYEIIYFFELLIQLALMLLFIVLIFIIPSEMKGILFIIPILLIVVDLIKQYIKREIEKICKIYEETIDTTLSNLEEI